MTTSLDQTSSDEIPSGNEKKSNTHSREEADETKSDFADGYVQSNDLALLDRLKSQIEFYFSPQNMSRDTYLRSLLSYSQHHPNGAVPLSIIATFPKVRKLCAENQNVSDSTPPPADPMLVKKALRGSMVVAVSPDGAWIIPLFQTFPHPSVSHQHQMISSHPQQFAPSVNSNAVNIQRINDIKDTALGTKERTTVILRDVSENCDVQKVLDTFTTESVTPKSARPDIGGTWYIVFASESDALKAVSVSKDRQIDGKSIRARVKSEANPSTEISQTPSPSQLSSGVMHPGNDGVYTKHNNAETRMANHPATTTQQAHNIGGLSVPYIRTDAPRSNVGLQMHLHHQPPPSGYPPFPHANQAQYYTAQQQQIYPPQYGMPLHMAHSTSASPTNYAYATPLQPYGHQSNHVRPPMHQFPYYVNSAPIHHQKEHYRRRIDSRNGQVIQGGHMPSQFNHYYPNEGANSNTRNNIHDDNKMAVMKSNDTNRNETYGSRGKLSHLPNLANTNLSQIEQDNLHQKGNKGNGFLRNRNQKNNGSMGHTSSYDAYGNKVNMTGNGEKKGKKKNNRKKDKIINNGNGAMPGSRQNQLMNGNKSSPAEEFSDATVLNALNFPELKIDGKTGNDDVKPDTNNSTSEDTLGASSRGQLTGYAAALLKKRSDAAEENA